MLIQLSFKPRLFLLMTLLLIKASVAESRNDLAAFDDELINIEKLIDNNALLAHQQLLRYEKHLTDLTIKQQISYHNLLTDIYIFQTHYHLAKTTANLGLSLALELSTPSLLIAELLYNRGFAFESLGDFERATQDYESGLEIAESFHDKVLISKGLSDLGAIHYLTDRYEKSLQLLHDAHNIAKQTNDEELKGLVNSELGILYAYIDRNQQSMTYYRQAYQHYKKAKKIILSLNSLVNIATNHINAEEYEQAITTYKRIVEESHAAEHSEIMFSTYSGLSWAYLEKNPSNPETSYQYLLMAKQYITNIELRDINLQYTADEAFVLFELERLEETLISIEKVEKILASQAPLGQTKRQAKIDIIHLKSKTYFKLGLFKKAYQLQAQRLALTKVILNNEQTQSVAEVRLALEAKRADLDKKILENKYLLQKMALSEASAKQAQQRTYLFLIAIVALLFAWLLVKIIQEQRRLHKASSIDTLTGIANRRSLIKSGRQLFSQAKTKKTSLSVLMIDVDHFKSVNDTFGHGVGDKVLRAIASIGEQLMRKTDVYGRFGGEEFIVLLPKTSLAQALIIAERYRESINDSSWQADIFVDKELTVSVSIGVTCTTELENIKMTSLEDVIHIADTLLYQAKSTGRNRVCS